VAPRTDLERTLAGIWAEVLGIEEIGVEDDFFSLGGDSLLAATLLARVEEVFPKAAALETLEGAGTVSEMARRLALG
jgi:acyl carrier protein